MAGSRWRSVSAYTNSLREMLATAGIEVAIASAPWFNPPSTLAGLRGRWTHQPEVRASEEGHYDIVHITDHALGHHVGRFRRQTPVVVTCHDVMPFTVPGYYRSVAEAQLKRAFLRRPQNLMMEADALIAVSDYTRNQVVRRYRAGADSITVVPNVLRAAFRPLDRASAEAALAAAGLHLPPGPRIVSVGHTQGYKNVPALLESLAQPSLAQAQLIRVGTKLSKPLRKQAAELGLWDRIHELGGISDELLALVYAASDVLVQPSLAEGFGIPVIEAMACGLPAVASDGGALPEVVGDAGIVVPLAQPDFPHRFAHAVVDAFDQKQTLRSEGLARAERYQPRVVLPELLLAYERALQRVSSRD